MRQINLDFPEIVNVIVVATATAAVVGFVVHRFVWLLVHYSFVGRSVDSVVLEHFRFVTDLAATQTLSSFMKMHKHIRFRLFQ